MEFSVETSSDLGKGLRYKDIKCIELVFKHVSSYALCILVFQFIKWSLILKGG